MVQCVHPDLATLIVVLGFLLQNINELALVLAVELPNPAHDATEDGKLPTSCSILLGLGNLFEISKKELVI